MSAGDALRAALRDGYQHSWRLLLLNALLSAAVLAVLVAATYVTAALVLLVLAGPLAAALAHCCVTLVREEDLRLVDALAGLRAHWRRGLELAALGLAVAAVGVFAIVFWARAGALGLPLAFLCAYLLFVFAVLQLLLWPLTVAQPEVGLRALAPTALRILLRRPGASLNLGFVLLLVNVLGTLTVLPLLTLTIAYSFLAAAHFALRQPHVEEAQPLWQA
jgi:hypothetical protein